MQDNSFIVMLDAVTDFEDAMQRMVDLCKANGEDGVASAASTAADSLRALERIMIQRGASLPVPEVHAC